MSSSLLMPSSALSLVLATLLLAGSGGPPDETEEKHPPTGTIVGSVEIDTDPPRRRARRYTRGRVEAARAAQELPVVAFLRDAPGSGGRPAGTGTAMAQEDTAFVPGVLVVPPGTTVEFPNHDSFFHNVFSFSEAQRFDLGRYPQGQSKSVSFDQPGIVKVYCEVHEFMRSAVIVLEHPHYAVVEDGTFRMEGVPAGRHTLVVWHADKDETEVTVDVPESGTVEVEVTLR